MALCIIFVDRFRFNAPRVSWRGTHESTIHSDGDPVVLQINTNYSTNVNKELQKFVNGQWIDVGRIEYNHTINNDGEGVDKYRVKVSKGNKVFYSTDLIFIKHNKIKIRYEGDTSGLNVSVGLVNPLSPKVRTWRLMLNKEEGRDDNGNNLTFRATTQITGVYLEATYEDGFKSISNTLLFAAGVSDLNNIDPARINDIRNEFPITWEDDTTANKTGYAGSIGVKTNIRNVRWEVRLGNGTWSPAGQIGNKLSLSTGINKIRGVNMFDVKSNELIYDKKPILDISISWSTGGKGKKTVINGTQLEIVVDNQYVQEGIVSKDMYIWKDTRQNIYPIENMTYTTEGNKMRFQMKVSYTDGTVISSNILEVTKLLIPKITWEDGTENDRKGSNNNIIILRKDLLEGETFKLQVTSSTDKNAPDNWQDLPAGDIDVSEIKFYKFRLIGSSALNLVSNVLKYERTLKIPNGSIRWEKTSDALTHLEDKIVITADPPPPGGYYNLVYDRYERQTAEFYDTRHEMESQIKSSMNMDDVGEVYSIRPADYKDLSLTYTRRENENNKVDTNMELLNNVPYVGTVTPSFRLDGEYAVSLVFVDSSRGVHKIGNTLYANIFHSNLKLIRYNYIDNYTVLKQRPDHTTVLFERKSDITREKSGRFKFLGFNTPNNYRLTRTHTIQKKVGLSGQWVDVGPLDYEFFEVEKDLGLSFYRIKTKISLPNYPDIFSNEVAAIYTDHNLKFDDSKYFINENVYNRNNLGNYNEMENAHDVTSTFYEGLLYRYEVSINGRPFQEAGNEFEHNNPIRLRDIFPNGYPDGITTIRLRIKLKDRTNVRDLDYDGGHSNNIYMMLNAAVLNWEPSPDDYNIDEGVLKGRFPFKGKISNVQVFDGLDNGNMAIYANIEDQNQQSPSRIIASQRNVVLHKIRSSFTEPIITEYPFSIDNSDIKSGKLYTFVGYYVNSFGFIHYTREGIKGVKIGNRISLIMGNRFLKQYEVKTDYPNATDFYYNYEDSIIRMEDYEENSGIIYNLQKADLGSDNFQDIYTLVDKSVVNGNYDIIRQLEQGRYRIRITVAGSYDFYSNIVDKYKFDNILVVNDKYSVMGRNILDPAEAPISGEPAATTNVTRYWANSKIEDFPEDIKFQIEWCHSERNFWAGDTITTQDGKKIISNSNFVAAGRKFNKTNKLDVNNTVGRHNGMKRIRLKVYKDDQVIGYSNIIWIYMDNSFGYFTEGEHAGERVRIPPLADSNAENPRYQRLVASKAFAIRCKHTYPEQSSEWYITTWWGEANYPKYQRRLRTITGEETLMDINRQQTIYKFNRKTKVPVFNIPIDIVDYEMEQIVIDAEISLEQRFVDETYTREGTRFLVKTHSISSRLGPFIYLTYNVGGPNYDLQKWIWKKPAGSNENSKVRAGASSIELRQRLNNLDTDGRRRDKYTSENVSEGATDYKAQIVFKGRIVAETNWITQLYFRPLLSLRRDAVGESNLMFERMNIPDPAPTTGAGGQPITTPTTVRGVKTVMMNRLEEGYTYKFQYKTSSFNATETRIDENNFRTEGASFAELKDFRRDVDKNSFYVYRIEISRDGQVLGYSSMVFLKT